MAYSTCSFNPIEDEAVVASLLSRYPCAHACSRFQSALLCLLHCFFLLPPPPTLYPPPSLSFQLTSPLPHSLFPTVPFHFIECEGVCETHTRGRRSASSR